MVAHTHRLAMVVLATVACVDDHWVVEDLIHPCNLGVCPAGSTCDQINGLCIPVHCPSTDCPQCERHADCPPGAACGGGVCAFDHCLVTGCATCQLCDRSGACLEVLAGDCPATPAVSGCAGDDDCAAGYACLEERCYAAHCELTSCPNASSCDPATGSCGECDRPDYPACTADSECLPGLLCVAGTCRPVACAEDSLCPAPARCQDGLCVVPIECSCGQCGSPTP